MAPSVLRLNFAGFSHIGMKRAQNQDHFLCIPDLATFIVADGMGGHNGGETASLLAVTTICDSIRDARRRTPQQDPADTLKNAVLAANKAVFLRAQQEPELQGMGTTATALYFFQNRLFIGHVGDSRCYLIHPRRLWQLTRDHSLVQEKLRAGLITRAQVKTDRMKNVITRSVGFEDKVEVDIYQMEVQPGDTFLICSDGLSGMCDDEELCKFVTRYAYDEKNLEALPKELCNIANAHGGDDNVTNIVVSVLPGNATNS